MDTCGVKWRAADLVIVGALTSEKSGRVVLWAALDGHITGHARLFFLRAIAVYAASGMVYRGGLKGPPIPVGATRRASHQTQP